MQNSQHRQKTCTSHVKLPPELWMIIFWSFSVDYDELKKIRLSCKYFTSIIQSRIFLKCVFINSINNENFTLFTKNGTKKELETLEKSMFNLHKYNIYSILNYLKSPLMFNLYDKTKDITHTFTHLPCESLNNFYCNKKMLNSRKPHFFMLAPIFVGVFKFSIQVYGGNTQANLIENFSVGFFHDNEDGPNVTKETVRMLRNIPFSENENERQHFGNVLNSWGLHFGISGRTITKSYFNKDYNAFTKEIHPKRFNYIFPGTTLDFEIDCTGEHISVYLTLNKGNTLYEEKIGLVLEGLPKRIFPMFLSDHRNSFFLNPSVKMGINKELKIELTEDGQNYKDLEEERAIFPERFIDNGFMY